MRYKLRVNRKPWEGKFEVSSLKMKGVKREAYFYQRFAAFVMLKFKNSTVNGIVLAEEMGLGRVSD